MSGTKEKTAGVSLRRALPCVALLCCLLCGSLCTAQSPKQGRSERLEAYLRGALSEETGTRYVAAFFDLDDDERDEAIVYLMGPFHCGTGGCETWVLAPKGSSYRVVSKISIVQLPIRALATKSHGWHDLGVKVRGGGILPGYEAKLSFNGRTYPHNPSVAPAKRITEAVAGKILIPESAQGIPLFP
jgi:hypothetical protein